MTTESPKRGRGRPQNLRKTCEILEIARALVLSESHSRRLWIQFGGDMKYISAESAALFEHWDRMTRSKQLLLYAALREVVDANRRRGLTTK